MHNGMPGQTRHLAHDPPVATPVPLAPALGWLTSQHLLSLPLCLANLLQAPLSDRLCPVWAATWVLCVTKALFKAYLSSNAVRKKAGDTPPSSFLQRGPVICNT